MSSFFVLPTPLAVPLDTQRVLERNDLTTLLEGVFHGLTVMEAL